MNWKTLLASTGLALAVSIGTSSCDRTSQAAAVSEETPVAVETEGPAEEPAAPDTSTLLARVSARWNAIGNDDWIQAYDYGCQQLKSATKLTQFLTGKEDHRYRNPGKPRLVGVDGTLAFVDIEVVWTPLHAQIYQARNVPPEGMTEVLRMIETWIWEDGEWCWQLTERRTDFYKTHEDLRPE